MPTPQNLALFALASILLALTPGKRWVLGMVLAGIAVRLAFDSRR
jgi:hypothetical protein